MSAILSATVVFPVPGLPVRLMCSVGGWELRAISSRSLSITSRAAISRMRPFTGSSATRSRSSCSSTSCTRDCSTTVRTSASPSETAPEKSTESMAEPAVAPLAGRTTVPPNSSEKEGEPRSGAPSSGLPVVSRPRGLTTRHRALHWPSLERACRPARPPGRGCWPDRPCCRSGARSGSAGRRGGACSASGDRPCPGAPAGSRAPRRGG